MIPSKMKKLFFVCLLLGSTIHIGAQNFGHCNFGELLSVMPETVSSDAELKKLNETLISQGEAKAAELQTAYQAYLQAKQSGDESPRQLAEREQKLTAMQDALQQLETEAQEKITQKRNELLAPIIAKASEAVKTVAKEKDLIMVFDSSIFSTLMFAEDSTDLLPLVKQKLGIQ